jgi:uncharacterized GH25 family protein
MTVLRSFVVLVALVRASTGFAHSPYLLPNQFDVTQRDHVSVQASFAEVFFVPDAVMKADDYHVLQPDGVRVAITPQYSKDLAVFDVDTKVAGTYRISTGVRTGRAAPAALVGKEWQFLEQGAKGPDGAKVYEMRSITRADVYVSRGAPTDAVLAPTGKGVEFQLLTHPNNINVGQPATLRVLYDGKPLSGVVLTWQGASAPGAQAMPVVELHSNSHGDVSLPTRQPGVFHVMTRHRFVVSESPARAESHTVAAVLEVVE